MPILNLKFDLSKLDLAIVVEAQGQRMQDNNHWLMHALQCQHQLSTKPGTAWQEVRQAIEQQFLRVFYRELVPEVTDSSSVAVEVLDDAVHFY